MYYQFYALVALVYYQSWGSPCSVCKEYLPYSVGVSNEHAKSWLGKLKSKLEHFPGSIELDVSMLCKRTSF